MEPIRPVLSVSSGAAVKAALAPTPETRRHVAAPVPPVAPKSATAAPRRSSGYGLPCAKCKKYYSSSLSACPVCSSTERVAPIAARPGVTPVATASEGVERDAEQERILREFKAKLYAAHTQITSTAHPCAHAREGDAVHESASVCKSCYAKLQARVDLLEAVLHMDLKEAAQLVYDAVWADTTDPNKTYLNAAQALLGELRRRAGMKSVMGRMQPLAH